ncbi:MAG TPA: hypothetical protein VMU10_03395 [Desulfomonilia bacterium]|nr:hypothetical protein [Desulfomonilia bacterium]
MRFERVEVSTGRDDSGRLTPETFIMREVPLSVTEIIDQWREGGSPGRPEIDYFKVAVHDGRQFILRHARIFDAWGAFELKGS